jgi:hypothetical protein
MQSPPPGYCYTPLPKLLSMEIFKMTQSTAQVRAAFCEMEFGKMEAGLSVFTSGDLIIISLGNELVPHEDGAEHSQVSGVGLIARQ